MMRAIKANLIRISMLSASATALAVATPAVAQAQVREFNIPAQSLSSALLEFSKQSDVMVVISPDVADGKRAPAVRGSLPVNEAIGRLLRGSGLRAVPNPRGGYRIERAVALNTPPAASQVATSSSGDEATDTTEIIVTAQKRRERLLDVPVPVAVVRADALVTSGQTRLQDYYTQVPGLNLTIGGNTGTPFISIRGITTGGLFNSTVGIVVDDISFASSTVGSGGGNVATDFDPSELERIEVLRGPQGTLYGANSMGGLLKYVTVDPSTDEVSGKVQVGLATVRRSSQVGYAARANVNVPLSETLAVRFSGSVRRDAGYIDNLLTGQDDLNETKTQSARIAALWEPTPTFSLRLSALYQHNKRYGSPEVHLPSPAGPQTLTASGRPDLGDLEQVAAINTGIVDSEFQAYSAIARLELGETTLTSLTGYGKSAYYQTADRISFRALVSGAAVCNSPCFATQISDIETPKFTQELRVESSLGETLDFLLGGYFTHESYPTNPRLIAVDPVTGAVRRADVSVTEGKGNYREFSLFGNVTIKFTDRFDVQVGGRHSWNRFVSGPSITAPSPLFPTGVFAARFSSEDTKFTYLVTPRLKISDNWMVYARVASGYRPGGPNTSPAAIAAGLPVAYGPDTTVNYEIGTKGSIADGLFTFDGSVYRIDWKDVQTNFVSPTNATLSYILNSGNARSEGAELTLGLHPMDGLTLSGWIAYTDAKFTDVPANTALGLRPGDRLPYSARWSGALSADYEFPIAADTTAYVGATGTYVGDRRGAFFTGVPQEQFPRYGQLDIRAGVRFDDWSVDAFVTNVTDKRGVLRSGRDSAFSVAYAFTYSQPRTAGLSVSRKF